MHHLFFSEPPETLGKTAEICHFVVVYVPQHPSLFQYIQWNVGASVLLRKIAFPASRDRPFS